MDTDPKAAIAEYFAELTDPQGERTKRHLLLDIVGIALRAVICGAEGGVDLEAYGKAKETWLGQFLVYHMGCPRMPPWPESRRAWIRKNCTRVFCVGFGLWPEVG